jgi:hypothetical protein
VRRRAVPVELTALLEAGRRLVASAGASALVRKRARRALRVEVAALLRRYELPGAGGRLTHIPCPFCRAPMKLGRAVQYTYPQGGRVIATPAWWHLTQKEGVAASQLQAVTRWARLHREGKFRQMVIAAGMAADLGKRPVAR